MAQRKSKPRQPKTSKSTTKASQPARDINRAQRVTLAIRLRMEGYEWEQIASTIGIRGGKGAAYNLVNNALKAEQREAADELRTLEALRLNALLQVYYPRALDGDGWSLDRVLRIMERRALLLGLDTRPEEMAVATNYTKRIILEEGPATVLPPPTLPPRSSEEAVA